MLTGTNLFLAVVVMSAVTYATRLFPFLVFGGSKIKTPAIILYLGKYLPPAIICSIIVYCFRNVDFFSAPFGASEAAAAAAVILLQLWRNNTMLSVFGGTGIYMILLRIL